MRRSLAALAVIAAVGLFGGPGAAEAKPMLKVGVGRADITPPTGYYMMGWVRSDAKITGQHTRLWARVIVLKRGKQKVALAAEDLNGIPGGMMADAAQRVRKLGFSERNVLDSASHTHAAPTSFYNFSTFNTVFMSINSPTDFQLTGGFDPQLYAFMVKRLALALRRANADLAPGKVGWGHTHINHLTLNRSIEAHLYDHGIHEGYGQGSPQQDPKGPLHPIDPEVNVLRVDKTIGGRDVPVGMWSTFANHGTVNKFQFTYYNEDHHGAATHRTEAAIRRRGHVPRSQDVVNAYGNTDEGDQSSGLHRSGPEAADYVGRVEARHFMRAWRQAGRHLRRSVPIARRWTRMCWCGQQTSEGPVADQAQFGLAEFTGSEEGRGPLFDVTRVPFEGDHLPVGTGPQGDKIEAPFPLDIPKAVPLMALRVGSRLLVSVPGEMTAEGGRRVRHAVLHAARHSGIKRAVVSGLANEYADYFTTPEEYDAQHYEGAATAYGRTSSLALEQTLTALTTALVRHKHGPQPFPYDPRNGVAENGAPFSKGANQATITEQPARRARRLQHPSFSWHGGARGFDRPLDRAFVLLQRHTGHRWRTADSDLGLDVLWTVGDDDVYRAEWEPPLNARPGKYRFLVRANRYRLASKRFRLRPSRALVVTRAAAGAGKAAVVLHYPPARVQENVGDPPPDASADLTFRPSKVTQGRLAFRVGGHRVVAHARRGGRFVVSAPAGRAVNVRAGAGRDRFGNRNGNRLSFTP